MSRPVRFLSRVGARFACLGRGTARALGAVALLMTVDGTLAMAQSAPARTTAADPISASLLAQVRIVEGERLQARTLRDLRLVARGEDYDEYALAVSVTSTSAWSLALLVPPPLPGSAAATVEVRDAFGAWRPVDASGRTDIVAEGAATREPHEIDLRFRISGAGRREPLARPRLLLAPALR